MKDKLILSIGVGIIFGVIVYIAISSKTKPEISINFKAPNPYDNLIRVS